MCDIKLIFFNDVTNHTSKNEKINLVMCIEISNIKKN